MCLQNKKTTLTISIISAKIDAYAVWEGVNWYQLDINQIFSDLEQLGARFDRHRSRRAPAAVRAHKLAEGGGISRLQILLHQFTSPLIYILLIAAVVTAFFQEYKDTGVIVAMVLINAVVGYIQEYKAEKNVRALKKMVVAKARVLRDGKEMEINGEEVVPGDIVVAGLRAAGCRRMSGLSRPSS